MTVKDTSNEVEHLVQEATARCRILSPDATVAEAKALLSQDVQAVVVVTGGNKLVGLITRRDLRYETRDAAAVSSIMTREFLVTVKYPFPSDMLPDMVRLIDQHRIKRLLLVADDFQFKGMLDETALSGRHPRAFSLLPFKEPYTTVYEDHVKPILGKHFLIQKADEIFSPGPIMEQIQKEIRSADLIIADVTEQNPNVYYEIGYAQALGKPIIFITQDISKVPFDIQHQRCIKYSYEPRAVRRLEAALLKSVEEILRALGLS
jgi:hypothetical protein